MKRVLPLVFVGLFIGFVSGVVLIVLFTSGSLKSHTTFSSFMRSLKNYKFYVVSSGSMEPTIGVGSVIFVAPQLAYNARDVVTFMQNGDKKTVVTHRIMSKEPTNNGLVYKTAGDANRDLDTWQVRQEHILGKVVIYAPYLGYVVNFAKQPKGFILLVIVPATIVVYEELRTLLCELAKHVRKLRKKKDVNEAGIGGAIQREITIPKIAVLVPIFGAILVFASLSAAFFFDREHSTQNVMSASISFSKPTPTLSPPDARLQPSLSATDSALPEETP